LERAWNELNLGPVGFSQGKKREVSMAQKTNFTPVDKYAPDRREAERLDLETQARLEAGSIDTSKAAEPVSATQPPSTVEHQHPESPSFWQAIKTMFK
jgi:hypothetical protein